MIKLIELMDSSNVPTQYSAKWSKLKGKTVSLKYTGRDENGKSSNIHITGTLQGFGTTSLSKVMNSKYITITINRTPVRVVDLGKVSLKLTQVSK